MGHIANKIDAKDRKLSEVLINNRYRIDPFQREYRWQRKQIEALISDLSISFLKNYRENQSIEDCASYDCYYMGPIVLCEERNDLSIIDGQQRLTSFTLLLIYLYHAQTKLEIEEDFVKDLLPFLYVKKGGRKTLVLNIDSRNEIIEKLILDPNLVFQNTEDVRDSYIDSDATFESIQNIVCRYEDITKLFPEDIMNKNVLPIFIEWLLEKVVMVEVKAYSLENAYSIFETMNDRGLTLSPTEILKGYLLNKINNEERNEEVNQFWKDRVQSIKRLAGLDNGDMDFFRAWLRAKYAITIRQTKQGAENEDFELIGTNFHTWVKNNPDKTFLKQSEDYYFFIRSDFDFYSNLYIRLFKYKTECNEGFDNLYLSNFYPIADSLSYPLFLSSISKIDDEEIISQKLLLVSKYIDVFVHNRIILGKAITQTSIRNSIYELVKLIRNVGFDILKNVISNTLEHSSGLFPDLHEMDNWGYYHYFFARILKYLGEEDDFNDLMRSRKQKSFVLVRIFNFDEAPVGVEDVNWFSFVESVAGYCLIRRYDIEDFSSKKPVARLKFLNKQGYLPEMKNVEYDNADLISFIETRDMRIRDLVNEIWTF